MNRAPVALERIKASPLARKRARQLGVDLDELGGSGPGGRIIARDVAAAAADRQAHPVATADRTERTGAVVLRPSSRQQRSRPTSDESAAAHEIALVEAAYEPGSYVTIPHDDHARLRADLAIASHLVPQQRLHATVRLDDVERALRRLNGRPSPGRSVPLQLTVQDLLVKAMGLALRQVRESNVSFTRAALIAHRSVDVAVLFLPGNASDVCTGRIVVADADLKSLSEISADRAARRPYPHGMANDRGDVAGGVTTVVDLSASMITAGDIAVEPPQSSVLSLGCAETRAVVGADGAIGVETVARLSLGFDTRAIELATAVRLLSQIASYLDDPMRMLV